jgi:hypothetical protein
MRTSAPCRSTQRSRNTALRKPGIIANWKLKPHLVHRRAYLVRVRLKHPKPDPNCEGFCPSRTRRPTPRASTQPTPGRRTNTSYLLHHRRLPLPTLGPLSIHLALRRRKCLSPIHGRLRAPLGRPLLTVHLAKVGMRPTFPDHIHLLICCRRLSSHCTLPPAPCSPQARLPQRHGHQQCLLDRLCIVWTSTKTMTRGPMTLTVE